MNIVLASASPRRSDLLRQIGLSFTVVPSGVEEIVEGEHTPESLVQELAYKKALDVAKQLSGKNLVIGADTVVVKKGVLGKPINDEDALQMLQSLKGDWHEVITGVSIVQTPDMRMLKAFEKTRVKMLNVSDEMLRSYILTREPMDKAGAYGIQGKGALLVEKIDGCYFNVVGLPLSRLSLMIQAFGIQVL